MLALAVALLSQVLGPRSSADDLADKGSTEDRGLRTEDPAPKFGEHWGAQYRLWLAGLDGTVSSDRAGVPGTDVRVDADLDVTQTEVFHDLSGWVQAGEIGNFRSFLWFGRFEGSDTLGSTISFGGSSYSAGTPVDSDVSALVFGLTYEYPLITPAEYETEAEFMPMFGLRYASISSEIDSASVSEEGSVTAFLPVIGARGSYRFNTWLYGEAELTGLIFATGGSRARIIDFRLEMVAFPAEKFFAGLGYHIVDVFTKTESGRDEDVADLTLAGFYLTVGATF